MIQLTKNTFTTNKTSDTTIQFLRYLISGGIAFVVDFCTMLLFHEYFGINPVKSATIGFCIGLTITYTTSIKWIFDNRKLRYAIMEFVVFALIGGIGVFITYFTMDILIKSMDLHYTLLKIMTTAAVTSFNFIAKKFILFSKDKG